MQGVQPEKPKGGAAGWGGEAQGGRGEGTGRGERSGGAGWGGSNEYGTSMEDEYKRLVQHLSCIMNFIPPTAFFGTMEVGLLSNRKV